MADKEVLDRFDVILKDLGEVKREIIKLLNDKRVTENTKDPIISAMFHGVDYLMVNVQSIQKDYQVRIL